MLTIESISIDTCSGGKIFSTPLLDILHSRSQDFLKGGSHCVKVRVLVCLHIFKLKRHGISTTCSRLFG